MRIGAPVAKAPVDALTERQRECMMRVATGLTSKQIARELGISPSTVDNHIHAAIGQLGASSRLEAARIVMEWRTRSTPDESEFASPEGREYPMDSSARSEPEAKRFGRLPPFGGQRNATGISVRLQYVAQIALLGAMLFAAITATISGVVSLFAR